jgi:hemolysin D
MTYVEINPCNTLSETNKHKQDIRILVVDDQLFIRELLQSYLIPEPDLSIVGLADSGESALKLLSDLQPDIALIDIEMPGMDGLMTTQKIVQHFSHTKVLVLSSHDDETYIRKSLQAGAQGYLLKNTPPQDLIHAIRFVHKGYLQLGPGLYEKLESRNLILVPQNHPIPGSEKGELEVSTENTANGALTTTTDETIWASGTQEQLDSLPQVWTRGLLYFLVTFTAIALPWAMFSNVDETGVARGRLEPKGATIRLDAAVSGTVAEVRVKEGQQVQRGQVLLELESDLLRADLQQGQTKLEGQMNRRVQLEQSRNQLLTAITTQQLQNQAQADEKSAQLDQARQTLSANKTTTPFIASEKLSQVNQAQQALNSAKTNLILAENKLQKDLDEVARYRKLWQQGAEAEVKVREVERTAQESQRLKVQAQSDVKLAQERIQEQRNSYQKLIGQTQSDQKQAEFRLQEQQGNQQGLRRSGELALLKSQEQLKDVEGQITLLKSDIAQSQSQVQALKVQMEQRVVRSPTNGVLFQFPIQKAKAYIQPGQLVAQIAPQGSTLILKAQMPGQNSGFLKVGMPVKLKFDSYPFQDYGIVPGNLRWISPDSKTVDTNEGKVDAFEIDVALSQNYIQGQDKKIELVAGLPATAEVVIRQRRIIDFLIDPFKQLQKGGLKL